MPPNEDVNVTVIKALGELTGEVRVMQQNIMNAFENIRQDMRHMEQNTKQEMRALEDRLNLDINNVSGRVAVLEEESKKQAINAAKQGVFVGGASTILTVGIIELLKKIHF